MNELFLNVVNMSLSASFIVLIILILRKILNKAPKWIHVLLWTIVAIRLVCPITIESVVSLLPSAEVINPAILVETPSITNEITTVNTGIPVINDMINPAIHNTVLEISVRDNVNILQLLTTILANIWIVGVIGFILYTIISCLKIEKRIQTAVLLSDNIYQSENIHSPFVFGVIKPRIYLPSNLSEQDKPYVIAHEQMHIRRNDHLWKPMGFILLSIYWFNPILWLAYILLCKDIELACDEKVICALNYEQRADYSQSLLSCSVKQHMITACPIAFGEVGVKERVKQIVKYKKPSFWLIVVAIVISAVMGVSLLTSPINNVEKVIEVNTWSYGSDKFAEQYDASNMLIDDLLAMNHKSYSIIDRFGYMFVDEGLHQFLVLNGVEGTYQKELNLTIKEGKDTFDGKCEVIVPSTLLNKMNIPYQVGDTIRLNMVNWPYDSSIEEELDNLRNGTESYIKKYDNIDILFDVVGVYEADGSEMIYTSLETCEDLTSKLRGAIDPIVLQFYDMTFVVEEDEVVDFKKTVNSLLAHSPFDYGQKLDYQITERE